MPVPNVRPHGKFGRVGLELLTRRRPANAARMLLARVFGNGPSLVIGTPGKQFSDALCERVHVRDIECLTPFSRAR